MTKYITYRDDGVAMVPFIVAESIATTQKTKIKRLICTLVLTLFLLIFTNSLWIQVFIHAYHDYSKRNVPHIEEENGKMYDFGKTFKVRD